jgi:uncharacterized protein YgfB (UPF0149 family)
VPVTATYADITRALRDLIARCAALGDCSNDKVGQLLWVLRKHASTLRGSYDWPDELSAALFALVSADCVALERAILFSQVSVAHHPRRLVGPRADALAEEARRLLAGLMMTKVMDDRTTGASG